MSELQAALLAIGFGVIVAVYVFGWWQQRRYRRKFGAAFKAGHADALYQGGGENPQSPLESMLEGATGGAVPLGGNSTALSFFDEPCELLGMRSDFIIELRLNEASHASVLGGFWQRKFDFGKPAYVCGMALNSERWERTIAESQTLYSRFRVALQLVDRSGAVSAAKLADFRDLVLGVAKNIKADVTAPDVHEAHQRAVEQDKLCAEVDQMVGINLVPPGDRLLLGSQIAQAAALFGMKIESDGAFHLPDTRGWQGADRRRISQAQGNERRRAMGNSLFSLVSLDSEPFQHNTLETTSTWGVTLLLDLPRVENPALQFDQMLRVAHELAAELQAELVDDHHVKLSEAGLERIRAMIVEVEKKMRGNGLVPGSAQARRLFS